MAMLRMLPQQLPAADSPQRDVVARIGDAARLAAERDFDAAARAFKSVAESAPDFPNMHYAYGRFLLDLHDVDGAIAQFQQQIRLDPNHVLARLQIAAAHYRTDSAAGIPFAEEAVKLDPSYPFGHYLLGLLYLDSGDAKRAVTQLETATKMAPKAAAFYFALGSAYAKAGDKLAAARARATFARLNSASSEPTGSTTYGDHIGLQGFGAPSASSAPQE
jgi:tetratricopeptide (TPR) repeat protein